MLVLVDQTNLSESPGERTLFPFTGEAPAGLSRFFNW